MSDSHRDFAKDAESAAEALSPSTVSSEHLSIDATP